MNRILRRAHLLFSMFFFDPVELLLKWRTLGVFVANRRRYLRFDRSSTFRPRFRDLWYRSYDRYGAAGSIATHYFHQDLWAADWLYRARTTEHIDVGSRLDGFVAHLLPFCQVIYVDFRPVTLTHPNFTFKRGLMTELPFADGDVQSLSSLHVIEHIGLGRYGDPIDPDGHVRAARELVRVLSPGGTLLIGTPVGRERLCFDAHRVFDPETMVSIFAPLELRQFALIDDAARGIQQSASFEDARRCEYGCGLFVFAKARQAPSEQSG
jgi:SAM-dependent methyltransferase